MSHRLDAADDGAGPSAGPGPVNSGAGSHHSASSPAALRALAIQRQLEGIETELSIVRAAVRDPQISDSIRGAVLEQQQDLLDRRKELETELRIHLDNLEIRRSDPNAPSSSREAPAEEPDEERPEAQRHRSKGKRRAYDDASAPGGNQAYYGSTYIARSLPRPEEGYKDKFKGESHKLREAQFSFLNFMFFIFWFLLDLFDQDESGNADIAAKAKVGHIPSLSELKDVLKDDPSFDSATVCLYGLRAVYEEGFCLFLRHEYGVEAEKHFRGNTISGCDRSVGPSKRVDKAIKHAKTSVDKPQKPNPKPARQGGQTRQFRRFFSNRNQFAAPPQQFQPHQVTPGQSFQPQGRTPTVICFKCHAFGHFANACPNIGSGLNRKT